MKNKYCISVLIVLFVLLCNTTFAFADETLKANIKTSSVAQYAPKWEEFCPNQYLHSEYVDPETLMPNWWQSMCTKYWKRFYDAAYGDYWHQRRIAFESEIKLCLANESTALACFMQVRQIEDNKTAQNTNQTLQAQQISAQYTQMMIQNVANFQKQIQAQQMNNNLNNINSSINNFNSNLNTNLNTSNSNLHAINHNLNRINHTLHY